MSNEELSYDFSPMIKVYKDGRVERLLGTATVPPSTQPETGVQSKDIVISQQPAISVRLYIPKSAATKLPLLVYFHGGGFCIQSASSPTYHDYLNSLVSEANVVAVSVEYRLAPEHPIPAAYDDSWAALKWVASHFDGKRKGGEEEDEDWITSYADSQRVFFAGDSAGANIAHHMGLKVGSEGLLGVKLIGIVLVHPYFWGSDLIGVELNAPANIREFVAAMWRFVYPLSNGSDDPLMNPEKDPKLGELGCGKVVVFVAEKDVLKERGWYYGEVLRKSGWNGVVEVMEAEGEEHCFHLADLTCENAVAMQKKMVSFLNQV
ncbi:CXE carboxylesterase [Pyrus ussuriensis x Pyrus communis]|uniref:CXE carboxylesterase n=1 Tax=Pyrus ussuriensis x Pyrus communis TaxID=2448454 RepID=A0A5N5ICU7_9ROSA|nr:CXE carboxylesterase [Pyrus ussuriensis x Pyrus communis]